MKQIVCTVAFILLLVTTISAQDTADTYRKTGDLIFIVSGLRNNNGQIRIALSDSKENYETKGAEAFREIIITIEAQKAKGVFKDIPLGEYAIKLIHDENGNGKIDTNIFGMPKEDCAFSNNACGIFGPPNYEKAKFTFTKSMTMKITILKDKEKEQRESI